MSDSSNRLYWVTTKNGCSLSAVGCTNWGSRVPKGYRIAGLASDDLGRRLFVSVSNFVGSKPDNRIYVMDLGFPRKPIQSAWCNMVTCQVPTVPVGKGQALGPITGLGFDACTGTLHYTDGKVVHAAKVTYPKGSCQLQHLGSCAAPVRYTGLCMEQRQPVLVGKSCVNPPCPACPNMRASTYGAPFLGNRNFALTLTGAPSGSKPAILAVGFGACSPVGFSSVWCGKIRVGLGQTPFLLPVLLPAAGSGPCDGKVAASFVVPPWGWICGVPLSAQWAMECVGPKGGRGNAISNCVTFEFTTN